MLETFILQKFVKLINAILVMIALSKPCFLDPYKIYTFTSMKMTPTKVHVDLNETN